MMATRGVVHVHAMGAKAPSRRLELKAKLLGSLEGLERGARADEAAQKRVDDIAKELEKVNPTEKPLQSSLLSGKWRLVYTTSKGILGASRPEALRPRGPIFQTIDAKALRARNQEPFPFFNGVEAELVPMSDSEVRVNFKTFKLGGFVPVPAPETATGTLDTTYLDEEMRVSRGNRGNLFVLLMEDPEERIS